MADEIKELEEEEDIYTLTDEDGVEKNFKLLADCEIEGVIYYALIPLEDDGREAEEYVILRLEKDENGEEMFVTIDDDDEFDRVADIFEDGLFGEVDFDEAAEPEKNDKAAKNEKRK